MELQTLLPLTPEIWAKTLFVHRRLQLLWQGWLGSQQGCDSFRGGSASPACPGEFGPVKIPAGLAQGGWHRQGQAPRVYPHFQPL